MSEARHVLDWRCGASPPPCGLLLESVACVGLGESECAWTLTRRGGSWCVARAGGRGGVWRALAPGTTGGLGTPRTLSPEDGKQPREGQPGLASGAARPSESDGTARAGATRRVRMPPTPDPPQRRPVAFAGPSGTRSRASEATRLVARQISGITAGAADGRRRRRESGAAAFAGGAASFSAPATRALVAARSDGGRRQIPPQRTRFTPPLPRKRGEVALREGTRRTLWIRQPRCGPSRRGSETRRPSTVVAAGCLEPHRRGVRESPAEPGALPVVRGREGPRRAPQRGEGARDRARPLPPAFSPSSSARAFRLPLARGVRSPLDGLVYRVLSSLLHP